MIVSMTKKKGLLEFSCPHSTMLLSAESEARQIREQEMTSNESAWAIGVSCQLFHTLNYLFSPFPHFSHPPRIHLTNSLLKIEFIKKELPCLPVMSSTNILGPTILIKVSFLPHRALRLPHLTLTSLLPPFFPNPLACIISNSSF